MLSIQDIALLAVPGILCAALEARNPSMPVCMCMIIDLCLIVVMLPIWRENIRLERELRRERRRSRGVKSKDSMVAWRIWLRLMVAGWVIRCR